MAAATGAFSFGVPTTTTTTGTPTLGFFGSTPATTSTPILFGTNAASTPATAVSSAPISTSATTTTSGLLFGSATTAAAPTSAVGGLFGAPSNPSTSAAPGNFGSVTSTATTGLFGVTKTSTAPATGGLFSKPVGSLFGTPLSTATTSSSAVFGTTNTASSGLGGSGTATLSGSAGGTGTASGAVGVVGTAASANPMEGDVPKPLLDLVNQLKDKIKKNRELSDEFAMNSSDECTRIDEKLDEVKVLGVQVASDLRRARLKANNILEDCTNTLHAAEQLQRRQKDFEKNPHYGQTQVMEYLQRTCNDYEKLIVDFRATLQKLEDYINQRLSVNGNSSKLTMEGLVEHIQQFDQVFKVIASQVYQCNMQVQDVKEAFIDHRRRIAPYAPDPFRKKIDNIENAEALSRMKGSDFVPSQVTMMKLGELARSAVPTQIAAPGFGSSTSLFGSKPLSSTPFSFNTASNTLSSGGLFKPFSSSTTSATAPLFGNTSTSTATTSAPSLTFGNTLNSSVSGTLFGGSASKPFGK
ncbi:hypothetical protein AB6A40_008791 [Gnathostoma spinigerum]|uniref:Nucleoporin p58/p45 n=1 Tax=Gnathostoma spinigerum TaxID=75299 RepID=A0ABD6EZB2_9BILA